MRELHYENQGINTFLVCNIDEQDSIDSLSLGMLTNNKIHGLAPTLFTQMDNQRFIKFNVSAKVSVSQFFLGAVNQKKLLGVFFGIVNAMFAAEDYMLDPASIIMDTDYIFTDVSTCETELICLPLIEVEEKSVDLGMFFRNIMFNTQFDQGENCDYVAKIINYLNGTPLFSLLDFKKLLEELLEQKAQPAVKRGANDVLISVPQMAKPQKQGQPTVTQAQPAQQQKSNSSPSPAVSSGTNISSAKQKHPVSQSTFEATGSKISFFYLMQHYNKENAAAYKKQKEEKKRAAAAAKGKAPAQQGATRSKTPPSSKSSNDFGFAIPGQQPTAQAAVQQQTPPAVQTKPATAVPQQQVAPNINQPLHTASQMPQGQSMNFGETTVLSGGGVGETTVLGAASTTQVNPYLIRTKNNEKINLDKPVFRIGKEKSYVDYFIGDNSAISRSHANIISRDGEYFIVDTNSTNHTYVNSTMIQSNVETKITHGAKIKLANEDFEFKLY